MKIRIGIIGVGVMLKYQIQAFREAGAEVVCLADTNNNAANKAATEYGIKKIYCSAEKLINSGNVDAVSILTPPASHKQLAIMALEAGKHVYCEKPPAMNYEESVQMLEAANATNKHLVYDFNNRMRPESIEIMKLIQRDFFGRINSAQAVWVRRSGIPKFGSWFTDKDIAGGGALIDLLHMIDLALYFMSYPKPKYVLAQTFNDFIKDT